MKNLDLFKPNLEQIFIGEFTPSGYAYVFPKNNVQKLSSLAG